ncbi:MAG TPA: outer membrane beta-barrel protein [Bacteroidales bacterium]|nr:outer membrane beta-barrel protein [Bacteroidales bacterium]
MLHPKTRLLILLLIVSGAFYNLSVSGQEDCANKIQEAQRYYDQGMIDEIPSMLAPCMQDGFTRPQKIEAYKLIIMSYLFNENQFEAEKTMLEFLKKYPEYEIMPNDPVEFVYLFESYRTASVFSFGLIGGINVTDPRIIERYTMLDKTNAELTTSIKPGFQFGLGVERYLSRKLLLNVELYFAENSYEFSDKIKTRYVNFTEKLYKVEIPLTLSYEFTINKTHFIARAGFSAAKLTKVTGQPQRKYFEDAPALSSGDIDITGQRRNMLYSGVIGAGLRYKVPRGVLSFDVRAKIGINNIVKSSSRFDNQKLTYQYYYLDDDFSVNTLSFSVGYYFSFYSPRKQR